MFSNTKLLYSQNGKKNLVALLTFRSASTTSPEEAKPVRINKNISFRPAFNSHLSDEERPIVLLYGWLVAKARHIYKYGDFYLGKGFDVIHVKVMPDQLLKPARAQNVVGKVLDFVSESDRSRQPLLYHGFSVGGYLYGETLVKIQDQPELFRGVGQRLKGQVFDSPVDFEGIPRGVSQAVTDIVPLQKLIYASLNKYLNVFYNSTTKHYLRSSEAAKTNKLEVPTLVMYSKSDPIAMPQVIEDSIRELDSQGIYARAHCYSGSGHVGHFHKHPVQYISLLNDFLQQISLVKEEQQEESIKIHVK